MMPGVTLSLPQKIHSQLAEHLFPGDGLEAAAVLVCTAVPGPRQRFLARDLVLVPHEKCERRAPDLLVWPGECIEQAIDLAEREQLSLFLVHSHPGGYPDFSAVDDQSDRDVLPCVFAAVGRQHGTAVMLPNGFIFARVYGQEGAHSPVDLISVAGDDLQFFWSDDRQRRASRPIAFTGDMSSELSGLTACVVGASGTGSIVFEQVSRLGFGRVVPIDFDHVEDKNLNRILNTTKEDAREKRLKVDVLAARANLTRDAAFVDPVAANLLSRRAVLAASQADVLFVCVDTHRGRSIADRIAQAFLMPLFDVGVAIPTRETPSGRVIDEATGRIDYVQPGGSTLGDRGVYTPATLQAEALAESDPEAFAAQVKAGYIEGMPEQAPAVISLNMRAASACVMEFIARGYPFRHEPNGRYARTRFMLAECFEEFTAESEFTTRPNPDLGRGSREPLLGLPALGTDEREAP
jgi:ThiF family/Prokaryotic homologs of the JAB domain